MAQAVTLEVGRVPKPGTGPVKKQGAAPGVILGQGKVPAQELVIIPEFGAAVFLDLEQGEILEFAKAPLPELVRVETPELVLEWEFLPQPEQHQCFRAFVFQKSFVPEPFEVMVGRKPVPRDQIRIFSKMRWQGLGDRAI